MLERRAVATERSGLLAQRAARRRAGDGASDLREHAQAGAVDGDLIEARHVARQRLARHVLQRARHLAEAECPVVGHAAIGHAVAVVVDVARGVGLPQRFDAQCRVAPDFADVRARRDGELVGVLVARRAADVREDERHGHADATRRDVEDAAVGFLFETADASNPRCPHALEAAPRVGDEHDAAFRVGDVAEHAVVNRSSRGRVLLDRERSTHQQAMVLSCFVFLSLVAAEL